MNTVKSFQVVSYFNANTHDINYGVVVKFGRKKTDLKRFPLLFKTDKRAEKFYDDIISLIGLTELALSESPVLSAAINKHKRFATNYKPKNTTV